MAELADDAQVAPTRILPRQPEDEFPNLPADGWTTQLGVGPAATDQVAMPAQDRRGGDHQRRPSISGKHAGQQRQHRPIRGLEIHTVHLTAQHIDLMAQHCDLHLVHEA